MTVQIQHEEILNGAIHVLWCEDPNGCSEVLTLRSYIGLVEVTGVCGSVSIPSHAVDAFCRELKKAAKEHA